MSKLGEQDLKTLREALSNIKAAMDVFILRQERVNQFLRNLQDPEMYGHAVTAEVRGEAKRLLYGYSQ